MTGADVKGAAEEGEAVTGLWLDGEAVTAEEGEAVTGLWVDGEAVTGVFELGSRCYRAQGRG